MSKTISDTLGSIREATGDDAYCVEFYDPTTLITTDTEFRTLERYRIDMSKYMSGANLISPYKYLSQMTLNIEPVWRIYEVPLVSKNLINTDHPPRS